MTRDRGASFKRTARAPRAAAWAAPLAAALLVAALPAGPAAAIDHKAKAIAAERPPVLSLQDALLHDAASPIVGNPDGDVTIIAFVDYNCPYCKRSEANLEALIGDDPNVRVIYKDWPILSKTSVAAAKVAIAANLQGKYAPMHKALMQMRTANDAEISRAAVAAGVDLGRLNRDLDTHDGEIVSLLKRNIQEAEALQIKGTPVYLIGPFITASPLDLPQFKKIVADAREDQAMPAAPAATDAKP